MKNRYAPKSQALASLAFLLILSLSVFSCATTKDLGKDVLAEVQKLTANRFSFRGSTLDRSGPIPVVILKGTPYERGFAYGVLLRTDVAVMETEGRKLRDAYLRQAAASGGMFASGELAKRLSEFEKATPKEYLDEMRGLAEGAGVAYEEVLFLCAGDGSYGCTSILSPSSRGGLLHGRNFDYDPYILGKYPVIVRYETPGSVSYWNISTIGYLPCFNGCNEEGISLSLNAGGEGQAQSGYVPTGWKAREILSRSRNLGNVRETISKTPNDGQTWILVVGSAQEKAGFVFDLSGSIKAETLWKSGKPMPVFNRPFGDGRHEADGLAKTMLGADEAFAEYNVLRAQAADRFLFRQSIATPEDMWAFLRDRSFPVTGLYATGNGTIVNERTMFSIVFDLGYFRFFVATGASWSALREVWEFDMGTRAFKPFLAADPFVTTETFRTFEEKFLFLADNAMAGTLTAGNFPDDVTPYLLLGDYISALIDKPEGIAFAKRVIAANLALYPDFPLLRFASGYLLMKDDPEAALSEFRAALASSWLTPSVELAILRKIAGISKTLGKTRDAAWAAKTWLAKVDEYAKTFSVAGYADARAEMTKISGAK